MAATVLGPVDTADLGFTLSHEHIMVSAAGMSHTYPGFHDREATCSSPGGCYPT